MAITLGSLFVELRANTGQFLGSMTKAQVSAKNFGREMQGSLGRIGELFAPLGEAGQKLAELFGVLGKATRGAFTDIGKSGALLGSLTALTGGTAALAGGLFALADHAAEVGNRIFEASEKTGIGADQMSGLMAITKETGGNFDALVTSLARAGGNLSGLAEHGKKAGAATTFLALAAKEAGDNAIKPMGGRIQAIIAQFFKWNNEGDGTRGCQNSW